MAQSMAQSSHQKMLRKRCECVAIRTVHVFFISYLIIFDHEMLADCAFHNTHTQKKHTPKVLSFKTKRETNERHTHELPMNYQ